MTPTQPGDGAVNITVDSTDLTTDGQRNMQMRITAFISEVKQLKAQIRADTGAYMDLFRDYEVEREARTNAQIERDAVALKLKACGVLLQRVLDADAGCTGEAYAQLIEDIKAAMAVQS